MPRDLARALSLATLCFIPVWTGVLDNPSNWPRWSSCWAVLIDVVLLAAIFFAAITAVRRSGSARAMTVARGAFLLVLAVPLNAVLNSEYSARRVLSGLSQVDARLLFFLGTAFVVLAALVTLRDRPVRTRIAVALAAAVPLLLVRRSQRLLIESAALIAGMLALRRWGREAIRAATTAVLVLFPFTLFTFAQTLAYLSRFHDKPLAPRLPADAAPPRRVVWLVFDELDYRLAFAERPASLVLDELDRLASESLAATHAYPPANYSLMSLPALIMGRLIARARVVSPAELLITYGDSNETVRWSTQDNVFAAARRAGVNSAVVGWFNPYCRVIGDSLTACDYADVGATTVWQSMGKQARRVIETIPFGRQLRLAGGADGAEPHRGERHQRVDWYEAMLQAARRTAADPSFGLVLLHWPVPHPPGIYDRARDALAPEGESSYIDNLRLVDRTMSEIRRAMEAAGTWDGTTVLVTSDHWWRHELWRQEGGLTREEVRFATRIDHRVPFLLKLAGARSAVTYEPPFNTVVTHDLILAILAGEVQGPADALAWLDRHRSIGESPYQMGVTSGRLASARAP